MGMPPRNKRVIDGSSEFVGREERWHVVKGIPIAFIVTMTVYALINGGVGIWYASAMNSRIDAVEKMQANMAPQGERLTRLEEKVVAVQATANRIETLLTQGQVVNKR
jgi:hypothetical protein